LKNALIGNIKRFENLEHLYDFDDEINPQGKARVLKPSDDQKEE